MLFILICGTTTLSQPDPIPVPRLVPLVPRPRDDGARFAALPNVPRDVEGPVFTEPWEAQAFALAVTLCEQGHFTWKEWAEALANELSAATIRAEPDDGSRYYHHWLAALEQLVTAKSLADSDALVARKEAWAEAYRRTPHGQPIELVRHAKKVR
jgi:nitrile hydratase accessory protein